MKSLRYFSEEELKCKCGCDQQLMDKDFMKAIDDLRELYGKPLIVTSAYRCPEYNNRVSSSGKTGPHTTGKAIDLLVSYGDAWDVLYYAMGMRFSGIGINQKGGVSQRFIHIDDLHSEDTKATRPTVWSY